MRALTMQRYASGMKEPDYRKVIEDLATNPDTAFLNVRSGSDGCYTMGVERV